ncbi:MAG: hypothetical protein RRY38_00775, partial [Oscillospiraceae bacterium]
MNDIFFNLEGASASDINAELRRCAGQCGFARYSCAGHSVCSREIGALELGSLYRPALIIGGTHGTEWVSVFSALRLALELSRCASERTCE